MLYFIPSRLHGILDYIVGIALIAAPWVLGFADNSANNTTFDSWATWSAVGCGVTILVVSLLTRYEYSLANVIPFSMHLIIDLMAGIFLAVSPWFLHFADYVYLPHVIVGVAEVVIAMCTVRVLSTDKPIRGLGDEAIAR